MLLESARIDTPMYGYEGGVQVYMATGGGNGKHGNHVRSSTGG